MVEETPQPDRAMRANRWFTPIGVAMTVPLALAVLVLWTSPNFQQFSGERVSPFGGDFLQEWVGGHVVASDQRGALYDKDHFQSVQHDVSLLGFEWKESSYYPPVYPPGYYFLLSPLAGLSYSVAAIVWLVMGLLGLLATFLLLYWFHPGTRKLIPAFPICTALFSPLLFSLVIGHKSTILLLIFTATYLLLYHKKARLAGLCFGLIAFKPHFVIIIALVMLWKRNWPFVIGMATTCSAWLVLSLLAGQGLLMEYANVLLGAGDYVQTNGYQLEMAHSIWGFFELLLGGQHHGLAKFMAATVCLGVVGWLFWMVRGRVETCSDKFAFQFSGMMIVTVLVSPHFYHYDLTILLLPLVVLTSISLKGQKDKLMLAVIVGFGMGAGLFTTIASNTSIQFSCLMLISWLVLLNLRIQRFENASESPIRSAIAT